MSLTHHYDNIIYCCAVTPAQPLWSARRRQVPVRSRARSEQPKTSRSWANGWGRAAGGGDGARDPPPPGPPPPLTAPAWPGRGHKARDSRPCPPARPAMALPLAPQDQPYAGLGPGIAAFYPPLLPPEALGGPLRLLPPPQCPRAASPPLPFPAAPPPAEPGTRRRRGAGAGAGGAGAGAGAPLPPTYRFSEADLRTVLYGALRAEPRAGSLHAISGLRLPPARAGKGPPPARTPPRTPAPAPLTPLRSAPQAPRTPRLRSRTPTRCRCPQVSGGRGAGTSVPRLEPPGLLRSALLSPQAWPCCRRCAATCLSWGSSAPSPSPKGSASAPSRAEWSTPARSRRTMTTP